MLYFLPDKFTKSIRYYGFYAQPSHQLKTTGELEKPLWAEGIKHLFDNNPEKSEALFMPLTPKFANVATATANFRECPSCNQEMASDLIFSRYANRIEKRLRKSHLLINGYFYPKTLQRIRPP